jgi:hypothetical protein
LLGRWAEFANAVLALALALLVVNFLYRRRIFLRL